MSAISAQAEYRAYELEIFDRIQRKSEVVITSFSPNDYILSNGGPQRVGVIIRASWICYGDTSDYKQVCPQPQPVNPRFNIGDRVQIILKPHITDQWIGVVENIFFRPDLKSNVYGVRFPQNKNLYTRYYEAHLNKAP
ncbi:hypothetical protein WDW89_01380 [Deltaproteobacteria bacterium TL4]